MKTKIIYLMLLLGMACSSCDSFLDVKPKDKVLENQIYSSELGFQRALNGIYIGMTTPDLFTENLSCGMLDIMGQRYYLPQGSSSAHYYNISNYKFEDTDVKARIERIWTKTYELIAECNLFLEHLQKRKDLFTEANYKLYAGEAYGLRGFLHLEMLRLFGPVYNGVDEKTKESIPYYDHFTNVPVPILTADSAAKRVIEDLDTALALLKEDPICTVGITIGYGFWDYRNFRMNYYAVWAVKARACLHFGQKADAFKIASSLVSESKDPSTEEPNNFGTAFKAVDRNLGTNDLIYQSEQLFCMHNLKRDGLYKALFSEDIQSENRLRATTKYVSDLYRAQDIRRKEWKLDNDGYQTFTKLAPVAYNSNYPYRHQTQSILRLGELFLVAAEAATDNDIREQYLDALRILRGFEIGNIDTDLNTMLYEEYQREFCGEGQFFYYLKRNNIPFVTLQDGAGNITLTGSYQLSLPDSEKKNRN